MTFYLTFLLACSASAQSIESVLLSIGSQSPTQIFNHFYSDEFTSRRLAREWTDWMRQICLETMIFATPHEGEQTQASELYTTVRVAIPLLGRTVVATRPETAKILEQGYFARPLGLLGSDNPRLVESLKKDLMAVFTRAYKSHQTTSERFRRHDLARLKQKNMSQHEYLDKIGVNADNISIQLALELATPRFIDSPHFNASRYLENSLDLLLSLCQQGILIPFVEDRVMRYLAAQMLGLSPGFSREGAQLLRTAPLRRRIEAISAISPMGHKLKTGLKCPL